MLRPLGLLVSVTFVALGCDSPAPAPAPVVASSVPVAPTAAPVVSAAPSASAPAAAASAPTVAPSKIAVQHVLITYKGAKDAPKGVTRSKADAKKRAEEVRDKTKGGTDFSALAAEYTEDPGSKERQGNLGTITKDKVVKPFGDAAFLLPVDGVSDIVESPFGFHVIKRNQ